MVLSQAMTLLAKYLGEDEDLSIKIGAIMGLGITYANSRNGTVNSLALNISQYYCFLIYVWPYSNKTNFILCA